MGMARSGTGVMLPSDGDNGAMHMGPEEVANNDQSLLVGPAWPAYDRHNGKMGENGEGRVPILEGDGTRLLDEDGNCIYGEPGWRVMHDQNGSVLWDNDGQLCYEEVEEDLLAVRTRSLCKQVLTAAQLNSMVEQNQWLQQELEWLQFVHQTDAERAQELMSQKDAQNQSNFRAMTAEMERKKAEWAEE